MEAYVLDEGIAEEHGACTWGLCMGPVHGACAWGLCMGPAELFLGWSWVRGIQRQERAWMPLLLDLLVISLIISLLAHIVSSLYALIPYL